MRQHTMNRLPSWISRLVIAAVVLFSPALACLMAIFAEMLIDLLMEAGAAAILDLVAAGAIAWVMFRKTWRHPKLTSLSADDDKPRGGPAIATPIT
jgi:hypothetical protein